MNITSNEKNAQLPGILYVSSSIYLALVGFLGIGLNSTALAKLIKIIRKRNTEQNFMLINLILSELAISLVAIPLDLIGSISHGTLANDMSCSLQGFIHTFFGLNSMFTIAGMATVRYFSVVKLERSWHTHDPNIRIWSSFNIQTCWISSFIFAAPPLAGFGNYTYEISRITCSPNWSTRLMPGIVYNCSLMILAFLIPTLIIIVTNGIVITKLHMPNKGLVADEKVSANKRKMFRRSKDSRNRLQRMRSQKRVKAATSAVAIMTVSFYICWLPYAITSTISIFGMSVAFVFSVPSFLFAKLGVLANPIIYIFFNQEIVQSHRKSTRRETTRRKSFSVDCKSIERNEINQPLESTRYKTLTLRPSNCLIDERNSQPNCSSTFKSSPVIMKQSKSCPFLHNELNDFNFCDLSTYL